MPENNSLDNIELRSEEVQDILEKVPHWMIRWGNVLFLSLIILLLIISWFIKYPDIIISEATITTSTPPEKEFAKVSGKIDAILVKDNEKVMSNQPLAIIENTANHQDVFKLKRTIDSIKVNNKSFEFPIDSFPILFLGDIESQYALFENSYLQYKLNQKLQPYTNESLANQLSISEQNRRLRNMQSQKKINQKELLLKRKDLERHKSLFEKGVISKQDFENKQLEYAQAERNFQTFESTISQIRESINNTNKNSKGTEINRLKEEMSLLKSVIQNFNLLKKVIKDWENRYVLRSNINGIVGFLNIWSINQNVAQGDLIFTVIPYENSSFIAKLKTPSLNSGKIKVEQKVNIKLENYPDTEFGVLNGIVKNISLLPDKEGNYYVDVELPEKLITSYNKEIVFKQEMRGTAEIITEDLRLLERFFYQLKDIFER